MSKHTPGPWKAVYVGCNDWDLSGPITEEDWKLAAAPDLLNACRMVLMLERLGGMPPGVREIVQEVVNDARAAIAKVEEQT